MSELVVTKLCFLLSLGNDIQLLEEFKVICCLKFVGLLVLNIRLRQRKPETITLALTPNLATSYSGVDKISAAKRPTD